MGKPILTEELKKDAFRKVLMDLPIRKECEFKDLSRIEEVDTTGRVYDFLILLRQDLELHGTVDDCAFYDRWLIKLTPFSVRVLLPRLVPTQ